MPSFLAVAQGAADADKTVVDALRSGLKASPDALRSGLKKPSRVQNAIDLADTYIQKAGKDREEEEEEDLGLHAAEADEEHVGRAAEQAPARRVRWIPRADLGSRACVMIV